MRDAAPLGLIGLCGLHVLSAPRENQPHASPPQANNSRTSASHRQQPLIKQFNEDEDEEEALLVQAGMVWKLGKRVSCTGQGWVGAGPDLRVGVPQFTPPLSEDGNCWISWESLWRKKVNWSKLKVKGKGE